MSTGTFSSDNTTLDEEVLNALEGLKSEGELSDVVETDNYYYVLRLDEITDADATEEHRQEIISSVRAIYIMKSFRAGKMKQSGY